MQTFWYQHLFLILKKCSDIFFPHATNCYKHPLWRFTFIHCREPNSGWLLLPNVLENVLQIQFLCQVLYILLDPSNLTFISHASDYPFPIYCSIYWKPSLPLPRRPAIINLGHFLRTFTENSAACFSGISRNKREWSASPLWVINVLSPPFPGQEFFQFPLLSRNGVSGLRPSLLFDGLYCAVLIKA